jgi:hypothetical protein
MISYQCSICRSDAAVNHQQLSLQKSESQPSVPGFVSASNDSNKASKKSLHPPTADEGFVRAGLHRSATQPLTEQELRHADDKAMSGASIADRSVHICLWMTVSLFLCLDLSLSIRRGSHVGDSMYRSLIAFDTKRGSSGSHPWHPWCFIPLGNRQPFTHFLSPTIFYNTRNSPYSAQSQRSTWNQAIMLHRLLGNLASSRYMFWSYDHLQVHIFCILLRVWSRWECFIFRLRSFNIVGFSKFVLLRYMFRS